MTENQELLSASAVLGCAHQCLADLDSALQCDFEASTTAILWRALEMQCKSQGTSIYKLLSVMDK